MQQHSLRLIFLCLAIFSLNACSPVPTEASIQPQDYFHQDPSPYYVYPPQTYTPDKEWPVFVGIHPEGGSGLDCWNTWQPYADREGYVLVCPSLAEESGSWHRQTGMATLARVLNQIVKDYNVQKKFFFAGYSAGAQFVEAILIDYPQIVTGAAILAAPYYYPPDAGANQAPVLVIIGQSEQPAAVQSAQLYVDQLRQKGYSVNAEYPVGVDHRLTRDMVTKTLELYNSLPPLDGVSP